MLFYYLQKLTRGQDNWSLSEVMHAVTLLAHFHALASFVYGCGINTEINGHCIYNVAKENGSPDSSSLPNSQPSTPSSVRAVLRSFVIKFRMVQWPNQYYPRADSRFAPSLWETPLQSNAVSHWLGANLESTLVNIVSRCPMIHV